MSTALRNTEEPNSNIDNRLLHRKKVYCATLLTINCATEIVPTFHDRAVFYLRYKKFMAHRALLLLSK